MAYIYFNGEEVLLVVPVEESGCISLHAHVLSIRFGIAESSSMLTEEILSHDGIVKEALMQCRSEDVDGFFWLLHRGQYRAYGLTMLQLAASTDVLINRSDTSSVKCPTLATRRLNTVECSHLIADRIYNVQKVKKEYMHLVIELSSESEGNPPSLVRFTEVNAFVLPTDFLSNPTVVTTHTISPSSSSFCRLPTYPVVVKSGSMIQCLKNLSNIRGSRNEIAQINFGAIRIQKVQYLPPTFDEDVVFEFPPGQGFVDFSSAKSMEGMDKCFDGHAWTRTLTSNIHNNEGLKFRRSNSVGHLICENRDCDFLNRSSKKNETEWTGSTLSLFRVGSIPPTGSSIVCKICKKFPSCFACCTTRIYYVFRVADGSRVFIHLGHHGHPVALRQGRETFETISNLLVAEVTRAPTAKNSALALAAGKEFMDTFLVHTGPGPKEMLRGAELDKVMDKFRMLSSHNVRNIIAFFRSGAERKGEIDRILAMKRVAKMEYIHDSIFHGQGHDKVYVFKMLVDGPGSGVDLVRRMQPGGNLENCFVMFDHVKRVKPWTILACHVYDSMYCKVMTIVVYDRRYRRSSHFLKCLNKVMAKNGISNPNYKRFMYDSAS